MSYQLVITTGVSSKAKSAGSSQRVASARETRPLARSLFTSSATPANTDPLIEGKKANGSSAGTRSARRPSALMPPRRLEHLLQVLARVALGALGDLLGRSRRDEASAAASALRAEVDHPVGAADHVEVVLDHDHRVAGLDQAVEHAEQLAEILEVEARGGLVEDVDRAARRGARQLARELDALRLAARQRRRRLTELEVAEADFGERADARDHRRLVLEHAERLVDGEVEHLGDVEAF